jgi:ubiquinone biosynthesis protein UbiJ
MQQELQDRWAIALEVANDAPTTGSVVVHSAVLIAVYDEMEALRDEIDRLKAACERMRADCNDAQRRR